MRVSGKLVDFSLKDAEATIDLPPVDITKIKCPTRVLVDVVYSPNSGIVNDYAQNTVYVFPSPENPSEAKEYCQCEEKPVRLISHCRNCNKEIEFPPTIKEMLEEKEEMYPCQKCGKLRTKDEGGTTFTVCDECWDKGKEAKSEIKLCKHCGGDITIRNPSGYCDHLYYPDNCRVCKKPSEKAKEEIKLPEKLNELYPGARKIVDTLNILIDAVREMERRGR